VVFPGVTGDCWSNIGGVRELGLARVLPNLFLYGLHLSVMSDVYYAFIG
jgi:hypothetical protein